MKLKHKQSGVVLEGKFKHVNLGYEEDLGLHKSWYAAAEWEPVREKKWVNVTAECMWTYDRPLSWRLEFYHNGKLITKDGYRVVRVGNGDTFIIEKEEVCPCE